MDGSLPRAGESSDQRLRGTRLPRPMSATAALPLVPARRVLGAGLAFGSGTLGRLSFTRPHLRRCLDADGDRLFRNA